MWGLQALNGSGVLQIDQEFPNLHLRKKATISISDVPAFGGFNLLRSSIQFTEEANNPVIAFTGDVPVVLGSCYEHAPGLHTLSFFSTAAPGGSLSYFVFDLFPAASSGFGLEIYDSSGRVGFSSNLGYFKVVDVISLTGFFDLTREQRTRVYPPGRQYAIVQSQAPRLRVPGSGDPSNIIPRDWYGGLVVSIVDGFRINNELVHSQPVAGGPDDIQPDGHYVVVDVTGL